MRSSKKAKNCTKTTNNFIKRATLKHNGKYDYSLSNYKHSMQKVKIICPEHGVFEQTPSSHYSGSGCPKCFKKKQSENKNYSWDIEKYRNKKTILYVIKIGDLFKIGITLRKVKYRYSTDVSQNGLKYEIIYEEVFNDGADAFTIEQYILNQTTDSVYTGDKILRFGNKEIRTKCLINDINNYKDIKENLWKI